MHLYVSVCICMYHACICAANLVRPLGKDRYIQKQKKTYRYRQDTDIRYIQIHTDKYTLKTVFKWWFLFIWTVSVCIKTLSGSRWYEHLYLYVSVFIACISMYICTVSGLYQEASGICMDLSVLPVSVCICTVSICIVCICLYCMHLYESVFICMHLYVSVFMVWMTHQLNKHQINKLQVCTSISMNPYVSVCMSSVWLNVSVSCISLYCMFLHVSVPICMYWFG
jgi:hypothetical protein